ncbi:MAG: hypothetical protein GY778_29280 [bacterium]|nr:hypothetical protein [bacterium]
MLVILALTWVVSATGWGCSTDARHRVLSFFFDGVPKPGDPVPPGSDRSAVPGADATATDPAARAPRRPIIAHPPYRENKCGSCHNAQTGQLFRSPADGLCRTCHSDVPGSVRYVHGPVAVSDCLFCHHYHGSPHPALLLEEPTSLCTQCHDRDRLAEGSYHATIESESCSDCHYGHGGDDPFFLKRGEYGIGEPTGP